MRWGHYKSEIAGGTGKYANAKGTLESSGWRISANNPWCSATAATSAPSSDSAALAPRGVRELICGRSRSKVPKAAVSPQRHRDAEGSITRISPRLCASAIDLFGFFATSTRGSRGRGPLLRSSSRRRVDSTAGRPWVNVNQEEKNEKQKIGFQFVVIRPIRWDGGLCAIRDGPIPQRRRAAPLGEAPRSRLPEGLIPEGRGGTPQAASRHLV